MLGDYNINGYMDNSETPIKEPYLLWSPGVDGIFGPAQWVSGDVATSRKMVQECDDVTNFR